MPGKSHYSIKPFHPPLTPNDGVPLALAAEVRLLARLEHPNVIRPVTIGESSEGHHLVMEYVDGSSLDDVRREVRRRHRDIPLRVTVRILLDALAGLAAVHELSDEGGRPLGLVHRSMGPASVLVGADGVARVANLGVERRMGYMDALRKQHIDRRAELFAIGVMLWEGAANRRLFESEAMSDESVPAIQHTVPRLDEVASGVPRGVTAVCARALDADVSWRYPSAAALAEALEGAALDADALADHAEVALFVAGLGAGAAVEEPANEGEVNEASAEQTRAGTSRRRAFAAGTDAADGDPRGQRPPVPPPGSRHPDRFGKYTVLRHLAEGGMAEVYLARTTGIEGFEKEVVIKRLKPELAENPWATEQFLQEARIAATLQHPQIAQVHDVGAVDGSYYLAMEHVHGQDLRILLKRARRRGVAIPLEVAVRIVAELCGALHHAHEKCDGAGLPLGLVHRDVSPSNVLISYDGAVKLCDFGIAEVTTRSDPRKRTRAGKLSYMSPEQCRGDKVDRRSDLFVLAIVLYELTTMIKVFQGASERDVMRRVVEGRVRPPSETSSGYPPELERIVMKSLSVDPAARHASALEMMLELEAFGRERKLALSSVRLARLMEDLFPPGERGGASRGGEEEAPGAAAESPSDIEYARAAELVEIRPPRPWHRAWLVGCALAVGVVAATLAVGSARRSAAAELTTRSRAAAGRIADRVSAGVRTAQQRAAGGQPTAAVVEGTIRVERAALAGELPRGLLGASLRGLERDVPLIAARPGAHGTPPARQEIEVPLPREWRLPPLSLSIAMPGIGAQRLDLARWIAIGLALASLGMYLDGRHRHRFWRRRS
ncbi:MAG TPA: serine/threonine-protein kinase [Kofleriaceae bacterium]